MCPLFQNLTRPDRDPTLAAMVCMSCGTEINAGARFCPKCAFDTQGKAAPAVAQSKFCHECGAGLEPDAKFCSSCGKTQES